MNKIDIVVITILLLIGFYIYTLPVQENKFPFGEGDAAHQFGTIDYMASFNHVERDVPSFVWKAWYKGPENDPAKPIYPPIFFINGAIARIFSGERLMPISVYMAFASMLLPAVSLYFFMRKLYGVYPAIISSFLTLFAIRNMWGYIWGQRVILAGIAFMPIIFYCYYQFIKDKKQIYLYLTMLFLAISGLFHGLVFMMSFGVLVVFTVMMWIKNKKFPIEYKPLIIGLIIFFIVFGPFIPELLFSGQGKPEPLKITRLSSLFKWYKYPNDNPDNPFLYSYKDMHGYWTLPLVLLGIVSLLMRRNDKDMFMLSWIIGLYLAFHVDVLNLYVGNLDRLLKAESMLIYSLAAIGVAAAANFIKLKSNYIKPGLTVIFLVFAIIFNANPIYNQMKETYPSITRVTQPQYELAQWLEQNTEKDSEIYLVGTLTYPKQRFMQMLSHRALIPSAFVIQNLKSDFNDKLKERKISYVVVDYSDLQLIGADPRFGPMLESVADFENSTLKDKKIEYEKNYIRVFEYEG